MTAGQSHLTPGQSHLTAGQSHLTTGQRHLTPGQSHLTTGQSHLTPGQSHLTAGQSHLTPGQSHLTAGQSHLTPGQSHLTAGQGDSTACAQRFVRRAREVRGSAPAGAARRRDTPGKGRRPRWCRRRKTGAPPFDRRPKLSDRWSNSAGRRSRPRDPRPSPLATSGTGQTRWAGPRPAGPAGPEPALPALGPAAAAAAAGHRGRGESGPVYRAGCWAGLWGYGTALSGEEGGQCVCVEGRDRAAAREPHPPMGNRPGPAVKSWEMVKKGKTVK